MTDFLDGRAERHLCTEAEAEPLGARVHEGVVAPFLALKRDAQAEGFDLRILSGFRSFDRQLSIWNRKARGEQEVLDDDAVPLDVEKMSDQDLVFAILRWSALPGCSRHHWGTDLDVYDAAATPAGYEIQLIPAEVDVGGMFGPLHQWLDDRIANGDSYGFVRPYDVDRQGVAPERWHISYNPLAASYQRALTAEVSRNAIERANMVLKDTVLLHIDEIHKRFITNVNPAAT